MSTPRFVKFKRRNGSLLYIRLDDIESVSDDCIWTHTDSGGPTRSCYEGLRDVVKTFEQALKEE